MVLDRCCESDEYTADPLPSSARDELANVHRGPHEALRGAGTD